MDIMICRWAIGDEAIVAWVAADAPKYTPRYALERYLLGGETMEILEAITLPNPKQPGYVSDRCDYWRKALDVPTDIRNVPSTLG